MEFDNGDKPIVIKRVRKVVRGHHGGAWKVAFADFATAMMAFFLLLWLLEATTPEEQKNISGYFSDPTGFTDGGSPYVIDLGGGLKDDQFAGENNVESLKNQMKDQGVELDEETVQELSAKIESLKFEELKRTLETRIQDNPALRKYKDQIIMSVTPDGLQIQIVDAKARPMFDSGSDIIKPYMNDILKAVAETLSSVPNRLSVSGHTDAMVFTDRWDYSNWELSADRANAARRSLLYFGVKDKQMAQVVGMADSSLYDSNAPNNPINRRISILVMNERAQAKLKAQQGGDAAESPPADQQPSPEERVRSDQEAFNSFERLRKTMTRKVPEGALIDNTGKPDSAKKPAAEDKEVF